MAATMEAEREARAHGAALPGPGRLVWYPLDAILTQEQVAGWLGVSTRTVRKLRIRRWASSRRLVRYLARHVLEYLEEHAT